jgi:biotin transporter BioY
MILAVRILAVIGAVIGLAAFGFFSSGFRGNDQLLFVWVVAPFLPGYFAATRVTRHPTSGRLALAGLLLAIICGASLYALAIRSELYDGESLAGLWLFFLPAIQFVILAAFFIAALVVDRVAARRQRPASGTPTIQ